MDEAPERIWVQNDTKDHRAELSEMAVEPVPEVTSCFQEYTRTDISNALIAAAYEAACELVAHDYVCDAIRALTPDDARAAYDAAIRAAKIEGMREAKQAAGTLGYHCIGCGHLCGDPEKDIAMIRKAGGRSCCPERKMEPISDTITTLIEKGGE